MGLIGNPVDHSLSPFIHNFFAKQLNDDVVYAAFNVAPDSLIHAICGAAALGFTGLNVTSPHKVAAAKHVVSLETLAAQVGAVNLLKLADGGYVGYNTDVYGVQRAFGHHKIDVTGKTIAIVGAGGGAAAAAVAMAQMGCKKINFINRTAANAKKLASRLREHYAINTEIGVADADVLILATPSDACIMGNYDVIFDMNYASSAHAFNGLEMLVYQAALSYAIIRNAKVPQNIINDALQALTE